MWLLQAGECSYLEMINSIGFFSDVANHILENGLMYSDEESPSMFEDDLFQKTPKRKENFLNFNR